MFSKGGNVFPPMSDFFPEDFTTEFGHRAEIGSEHQQDLFDIKIQTFTATVRGDKSFTRK